MKKITLLATSLLVSIAGFAQTTLFSDDFESGDGAWTISGTGTNGWIVNNSYTGFSSQFGSIPDTPDQPSQISGSPQSNYLHIMNESACQLLSACNANFDTGSASEAYAEITNSFSTVGMMNTEVSFYWLCVGEVGATYGELEYSTDNGVTWTSTGTEYSDNDTWTEETVSLPAFNGVAELKFRFKWVNVAQGLDPAFSIDDLEVTSEQDVTGVAELLSGAFNVTPNPATDVVLIQGDTEEIIDLKVFCADGTLAEVPELSNSSIDISELSSGVYFISLSTTKGVSTVRFVKQ